jgi:hypothetical protein
MSFNQPDPKDAINDNLTLASAAVRKAQDLLRSSCQNLERMPDRERYDPMAIALSKMADELDMEERIKTVRGMLWPK